jgi:NCS2 family nucleobase:cation symporter-2
MWTPALVVILVALATKFFVKNLMSVAAAGVNMLSDVNWNRRNMVVFAVLVSVGRGLQLVPDALQHLLGTLRILLTSGLQPAAAIAIILNLALPDDLE